MRYTTVQTTITITQRTPNIVKHVETKFDGFRGEVKFRLMNKLAKYSDEFAEEYNPNSHFITFDTKIVHVEECEK